MFLKALIFDVDGTLANTEEAHRCTFNEAFQQHGLDWHWSPLEYAQLLRTTGGKERIGAYLDSLDLPLEVRQTLRARIAAIHATKTALYTQKVYAGDVPLREGVESLIEEARRAQVVLSIATTTSLPNIQALLTTNLGSDALALFSVIGAGDQVPRKKPAPDIYEWVLGQLALPASHCIAIEDSAPGLAAAKSAGIFTLITPSYWTETQDFAAADWVLPSLSDLEGALESRDAATRGEHFPRLRALERRLQGRSP
jgi:HAD superfamily hydrolase (TIGR01509 family)